MAGAYILVHGRECIGLSYINKRLACTERPLLAKTNYVALKRDIEAYIERAVSAGGVTEVSVYFRDLEAGPTFGIDTSSTFAPASLLKLPVAMALFSLSEDDAGLLEQKLLYSREELSKKYEIGRQINFDFSGDDLREGEMYPVRELIRASLMYSDNVAYQALIDYINNVYPEGSTLLLKAFREIGVVDPRTTSEEIVSVRDYSSLFRLLYNASFLSPEDSDTLLDWLAQASFDAGLEAGVPQDIVVASKFGERQDEQGKRLHDCGIIYYPDNPYTLCVMTAGGDWAALKQAIGDISRMVYQEVDSRAK